MTFNTDFAQPAKRAWLRREPLDGRGWSIVAIAIVLGVGVVLPSVLRPVPDAKPKSFTFYLEENHHR
ncbi:MAG: hypothetical protein HY749_16075 [Gammaproteobacteria bacterium]|nr:hypothetical protein [Gammaproteobacteria bacterium]